jgi:HK97 family phage portal protein
MSGFITRLGIVARAGLAAMREAPQSEITSLGLTGGLENRDGNPLENPATPLGGPGFWAWLFAGETTESGEHINDYSALQQATVYACVRVISESVASLPLTVYERLEGGRKDAVDNDLYFLLRRQPNPEMTAFTFFETMAGCLCLTGNCYAQIIENKGGRVGAIYPLHPNKTEPVRLADGHIAYRTTDGEALGKFRYIPPESVLHIPLFSFDGLKGLNPVALQKQLIGGAKAAEKFGARFFGNGSKPGGVLHPTTGAHLDETTISQVRESWQAMQAGINQGKVAVLPGDWTYQQIGLSPEDSQFLETRKYNRTDICGIFRVPPHMVGDTTRLSNNNHEQQSLQFVTDTLRPYLTRFEQEVERKLLPKQGRSAGKYFAEFNVRERLRGDFAASSQGYALGRQWGWYSVNDVLEDMGGNKIGKEGDIRLAPVNMVNLENLLPENGGGAPQPKQGSGKVIDVKPTPEGEGEAGLQQAKNSLRFAMAYIAMFRDAVGRVLRRQERDLASITAIFEPVLTSLAVQIRDSYGLRLGLGEGWLDASDVARARLNSVLKHSLGWNEANAGQSAMAELRYALVSMTGEICERAGREAAQQTGV